MKSFIRVKKIAGHEYLYEITPYYDPETKRTKHRSKYLGKNINGAPVKVRQETKDQISVYSYGEFIIPKKIIEDLDIKKILLESLSPNEVEVILILVLNRLINHLSLRHIESWYQGTILSHETPNLPLSSQSISDFLKKIYSKEVSQQFIKRFIPSKASNSSLVYDITSITSYSELNTLFEWGYERTDTDLPQVNLSVIINKELGIPIAYDLYPGSINDVITLDNILKKLDDYGAESYMLILDRGFCSVYNILELVKRSITWIMPAKRNLKGFSKIIEETNYTIDNPNNSRQLNEDILYVMPVTMEIGRHKKVSAWLYYDRVQAIHESDKLAIKLKDLVDNINSVDLDEGEDPLEIYGELAGSFAPFFVYKYKDGKYQITIKRSEIENAQKKMGKIILMYQGELSWDQCLILYKERDVVEKSFEALKSELSIMPLQVHREETMRGLIFIYFLALIIRMRMQHLLSKNLEKPKKLDVPSVFVELSKLKMIKLSSGQMVMSEMTKTQRQILETFKCSA